MFTLSIQRRVDDLALPLWPAPDDGQIFLVQLLALHRQTEPAGGGRIFRHQDKPARFAVETVHNRDLSAVGNFKGE